MNETTSSRRVRLVYRRSSPLLKVAILALVVLCMAALLGLRAAILNVQAGTDALRSKAASLEQENSRLEEYIEDLGTVDSVRRIAREELGLVDPDTIVFQPEQ